MTSVGVGIGVFAVRKSDGKFVVGERMGSTGAGTLALPGGHLEFLESFSTCAIRETLEETALNLELSSMTQVTAINSPMPLENKHYVTIFMRGTCVDENPTPINLEVNKCKGWRWISWEELVAISEDPSQSLFLPLRNLIKERGKDFHPLR
ncbi:NUDIX hydrolase domain-like protein [Phlyctochytrium arcticum]|nr:NUDIX hydrolase domain-like protein [Phlyctochytrium arcticum]